MRRSTRMHLEQLILVGLPSGIAGVLVGRLHKAGESLGDHPEVMAVIAAAGTMALAALVWLLWKRTDEFERQVAFISLTTAFVGTALVSLWFGVLQTLGSATPNWIWMFPVMLGFTLLGSLGATLYYR